MRSADRALARAKDETFVAALGNLFACAPRASRYRADSYNWVAS